MSSEGKSRIQVLQGTPDILVLRTLRSMGPQHVVRLEQQGSIKGRWDETGNGREAKYYAITRAGLKALGKETQRWRQQSGLVEKLVSEEF